MVSTASPGDIVAIIDPDSANRSMDARAFACPGLYRIVPAKDGGICRVRVTLGRLSSLQIRAIATAAARHGNGILEFTNRANMQIRGMPLGEETVLVSGLAEAGLAPAERWADDARNVLVNPSAGFDPGELLDVRPIAQAVLDGLSDDAAHAALSPKFSVQIDGGGVLSVGDHAHDIWLIAVEVDRQGPMFKVGLAGPIDYETGRGMRFCTPDEAADVIATLIAEFIESGVRRHGVSRMRDLLRVTDADDIWRRTEMRLGRPLAKLSADRVRSRATLTMRAPLGVFLQRDPSHCAIGVVPPLGRTGVAAFNVVADAAERFGRGEIRLTPWRGFLLPDVAVPDASDALHMLDDAGFIVTGDHAMAHRIACSGMAGCASALADVQGDAEKIASGFTGTMHLSGCAKSCAVPGTADVTLVAIADGLYDLYRRAPAGGSRFGTLIASRVGIDRARQLMSEFRA
jgi:precorrin-3B synthase